MRGHNIFFGKNYAKKKGLFFVIGKAQMDAFLAHMGWFWLAKTEPSS
jgi:hypothetical protein